MTSPGKPDVDPNSSSEQDISETSTLTGTKDIYEPEPVPSNIRSAPTNYLCVYKLYGPISGQYFIDASIPPVPKTVPHVAAKPENLLVHSRGGSVTADIWLTGNNKLRQVSMKLCCDDGDIRAKVHEAFSSSESGSRPSLDIKAWTLFGGVYLSLPRCFRGLITIKPSREGIAFSPALEEHAALLSDVKAARVYFVGDRPRDWLSWHDDDDKEGEEATADAGRSPEEPLDKIIVSSWTSTVQIRWEGEPELPR